MSLSEDKVEWLRKKGIGYEGNIPAFLPECLSFETPVSLKRTEFGHDVSIGAYSYIVSGFCQNASIGRYTSIGESVSIGRYSKETDLLATSPFIFGTEVVQGFDNHLAAKRANELKELYSDLILDSVEAHKLMKTRIGNDVWIGHNVFIKPGVKIGDGAVIGAHSVVMKDVPDFSIVAGVPAKIIRFRFNQDLRQSIKEFPWWNFDLDIFPSLSIDLVDIKESINKIKVANPTKREYAFTSIGALNTFLNNELPINSPSAFRIAADLAFSKGRYDEASQLYESSIAMQEMGLHYTYCNFAVLQRIQGNLTGSLKSFMRAASLPMSDMQYVRDNFKYSIPGLISAFPDEDLVEIFGKFGYQIDTLANMEDLKLTLVVGFPRCGTTSFFSTYAEEGSRPGIIEETLFLQNSIEKSIADYLRSLRVVPHPITESRPLLGLYDKSTAFSLSLPLLHELEKKQPNLRLIMIIRNGYDRSMSAYRMNTASTLTLTEVLNLEIALFEELGGVESIFENYSQFLKFVQELSVQNVYFPVLYPTILMKERKRLFSTVTNTFEEYDISSLTTTSLNSSKRKDIPQSCAEFLEYNLQNFSKFMK